MSYTEYQNLSKKLQQANVKLIAVSKTQPLEAIIDLYKHGQLDFGENKVQELVAKQAQLSPDIQWHMIGHLQRNKVKHIAPFVHLIHSVDSFKLLKEINKHGHKNDRIIPVLLQFHIAQESTKFGFNLEQVKEMLARPDFKQLKNIEIRGVMGMATFTQNLAQIHEEFHSLKNIFNNLKDEYFLKYANFKELSMGMSADYTIAIEEGATMVRIGSLLFGARSTG